MKKIPLIRLSQQATVPESALDRYMQALSDAAVSLSDGLYHSWPTGP